MRRINFSSMSFPILCTVWLALPAWISPLCASETGKPSWQQGVSTFDGTGYQVPATTTSPSGVAAPAKVAAPSGVTTADVNPYTMPVDPTRQVQPVAGYNYTDGSLNAPTLPPPVPSYTPSGEPQLSGPGLNYPVLNDPIVPGPAVYDPKLSDPVIGSGASDGSGSAAAEDFSEQMNDQLNAAAIDQPAPLDQEVIHWYQYPRRWSKGWDSHAEFGLDGSDGNAETLAIQTGLETKRKTDLYTFALDLDFRQASSRGVTTEENGRLNLDYDRMLGDSKWAAFGKTGLEWDKFKAFDLRLNLNGGLGYHWIRNDTTTLVTRFGAGASREFGSPIDEWTPEAVFGIEAERQLTERQKVKAKLDYFPSWADFGDYRLVTDVSWEMLLDGSENFSLKLSATDRYDSTPQGALANDLYYSLLLLYKF